MLSERIDKLTIVELRGKLINLIDFIHAYCGVTFDKVTFKIVINELANDLVKYFGYFRISELELIFKRGCRKEFGEYYGLNAKSFMEWCKAWKDSENRTNAKKMIEKAQKELLPKPKEFTAEEKEQILKDGCISKFNEFKETGHFEDWGNVSYDYLVKKDLLKFTPERKNIIKEKVLKELKDRAISEKYISDTIEKSIAKFTQPDKVILACKKEALKQYYQDLVDMEEDLKQLIKSNYGLE